MRRGIDTAAPISFDSYVEPVKKKARLDNGPAQPGEKIFACNYTGCDKAYTKPSKLKDHLRSHTGERPYCCSEPGCAKRFLRKSHLQAHAHSHLPKDARPFKCLHDGCQQRFSTNQHLQQHTELHARPKPYQCEHCSEAFHKNNQYKRHVAEVHLRSKPCPCPQTGCNMSFTYQSILAKHMARVHDPSKRYGCEIDACGETFLKWSHLQAHIKAVHKMRCEHCQKGYSDASALRLHVETHEVPLESRLRFACQLCDKKFTRGNALKKHVSFIHEGIREFACHLCEREFAHKRTLKSHVVREHANQAEREVFQEGKTNKEKQPVKTVAKVSLLDKLTGAAYEESGRDISCTAQDCAFKFTREYDLHRHLASKHPDMLVNHSTA